MKQTNGEVEQEDSVNEIQPLSTASSGLERQPTGLLPCPFCGSHAHVRNAYASPGSSLQMHWVECVICEVGTKYHDTPEAATKVWNSRADIASKPDSEELKEALGGMVAAFDGERSLDPSVVETTRECALNVAKRVLEWNNPNAPRRRPDSEDVEAAWLPIESAPKDGSRILILEADGSIHDAVYLSRKDIWVSPDGGYGFSPIRWLPLSILPSPPKVDQADKNKNSV